MKGSMSRRPEPPPTVHLTAAGGGHIDLLCAIDEAFEDYRRTWILHPSLHADALVAAGEDVEFLPRYQRRLTPRVIASALSCALRLVLRKRPKVVVTSGAGVTVPYCAIARLLGAQVIFVETMARVTGPSASGRILSRLASRTLVQWPDVLDAYPRSSLCRPALLESIPSEGTAPGEGTLVAVGTHSEPFDRMLRMVDDAVGAGVLPKPIVAQGGVSTMQPEHYSLQKWMTPDEMSAAVRDARYVVCHAGSGLVSAALRAGKRPMVLPRLAMHGEHFDDHQMQITERLAELGLVIHLKEAITEAELEAADRPLTGEGPAAELPSVEEALRRELEASFGGPRGGGDSQVRVATDPPAVSRS